MQKDAEREDNDGLVEEKGLGLKQRAELLDRTRWANDFSWPEMESFAAYIRVHKAACHALICREGDDGDSLFIIARGSVEIVKGANADKQKVIATIGPGQTLGEMSLLDGEPRSAPARAASDILLLTIQQDELDRMISERPGLAVKFVMKLARMVSQRLRKTSSNLADRLQAGQLLRLAGSYELFEHLLG